MGVIRCISEFAGWDDDDRIALAAILVKAGYKVSIDYRPIEGDAKNRREYVVVFEEK